MSRIVGVVGFGVDIASGATGEVTCLLVEEPQDSQIAGRLAGARVVAERGTGP